MTPIYSPLTLLLLLLWSLCVVADEHSTSSLTYNSTECKTPCENGTYEVMACSKSHPKLCKGLFVQIAGSFSVLHTEIKSVAVTANYSKIMKD